MPTRKQTSVKSKIFETLSVRSKMAFDRLGIDSKHKARVAIKTGRLRVNEPEWFSFKFFKQVWDWCKIDD